MTNRQLALLVRLEAWFDENPHASALDAARNMRMPPEAARAMVNLGVSAGRLIVIGSEVYTKSGFDSLLGRLREKVGDRQFQPRELREALGEGRVWTEHFADLLGRKELLEREPGGWRLKQSE